MMDRAARLPIYSLDARSITDHYRTTPTPQTLRCIHISESTRNQASPSP